MPTFSEQLALIAAARKKYAEAEQNLYRAKIVLHRKEGKIPPEQYRKQLAEQEKIHTAARATVDKAITDLHGKSGISGMMAEMDGHTPLLLFPLRIETRFGTSAAGKSQLWIRIYPDDICVNRHERWLTPEEETAGKLYWTNLTEAEKKNDEEAKKGAWSALRERLGMQRALWVARQTKPVNWAERLTKPLEFPIQQDTKTHGWTRAPRSAALPDRFAAIFFRDGVAISKPEDNQGAILPDTLILGPDPFDDDNSFSKKDDEVVFGEDFAWMADFKKAVDKGMGIIVNDPERYMKDGKIERLFVVGVLNSADRKDSANVLADLLENHLYSTTKGFSLIPQGTPTNNTEETESGFTINEDWVAKGYFEDSTTLFSEKINCDGKRLETALGIRTGVLNRVAQAGIQDIEEALDMNKALYPATLGYMTEILMHTVFGENTAAELRNFFTNHVTGRGPLPAVRVGDQPYGVLLTSDLRKWQNTANAIPFYNGLLTVLRNFQQKWDAMVARQVSFAGKPGAANPDETLLDILALQPASVSFRQRLGYMYDVLSITSKTKDISDFATGAKNNQRLWMADLAANGFTPKFKMGNPLLSHLFWYGNNKTVTIPIQNLIDGLEPSETEPIASNVPGEPNYLGRLLKWETVDEYKNQNFGAGQKAPATVLYLLLRQAILRQLTGSVLKYYQTKNKADKFPLVAFQKSMQNFDPANSDLSHWDILRAKPTTIGKSTLNKSLGDEILQGREAPDKLLAIVKNAIRDLENLPTARLERALIEHLDCCSYRLDAWQTGLFSQRLSTTRQKDGGSGIYLGAFGWVENLQKEQRTVPAALPEKLKPKDNGKVWIQPQNGGLLHAPSQAHATAAGLLLSGYRQYGKPGDPAAAFAVNVNSDRVRRAMFILEGIRGGQSLSALLGYQFERLLHETNLGQYIYVFRSDKQFQYQPRYIPQEGEVITVGQRDTAPAPVVDGLKIAEISESLFAQFLATKEMTNEQIILKNHKKSIEETLDAVKDLLMAESTFQAAKGNTHNQAALLNSLNEGIAPAQPEIMDTPRTSQAIWTNRVTVHFDEKIPLTGGAEKWKTLPASPRALLEPGVNAWLAATLGDPSKIGCTVSHADAADCCKIPQKQPDPCGGNTRKN
jgi:hypothetical protein